MKQIILASSSPRRKELFQILGLPFKVVVSDVDERLNPRLGPCSQAEYLSQQKAKSVAVKYADALIIAADTFVVVKGEILGKPESIDDARRMLRKLSGKRHTVVSGITVLDTKTKKLITKSVETYVYVKKLSEKEISSYLLKEEVLDKSGAYAIQGPASTFVKRIEGEFYNIVGLPLFTLAEMLRKFGISVLSL